MPVTSAKCGRFHLGPCLVNGTRPDGRTGPVCMECGAALSTADRDAMQRLWDVVWKLMDVAGGKPHWHKNR